MRTLSNLGLRLSAAALVALAAACTVPPADTLEPAPRVTSFTASAARVMRGQSATLTWATDNATSVTIVELKLGAVSGVMGTSGTVQVAVPERSTFVLTARNDRGASASAVVTIDVGEEVSTDLVFAALPTIINAGQSATLVWAAPDATALTITANGQNVNVGSQTESGTVQVSPTSTTTYTLTAGARSAMVTVTVRPTVLQFTATDLVPDGGNMVTLSWQTAGATSLKLNSGARGTIFQTTTAADISSGSFADTYPTLIDPSQRISYELEISNGTETAKASLLVGFSGQPLIVSFTAPALSRAPDAGLRADGGAAPSTIRLTWATRAADELAVIQNGARLYDVPTENIAQGFVDLPLPTQDTTYELVAVKTRGGTSRSTASVEVVGLPRLMVTQGGASTVGAPISFSWSGDEIRSLTATTPLQGTLGFFPDAGNTGSVVGAFSESETVTFTASNGVGDEVSSSVPVTVTGGFDLSAVVTGTPRAGESISISWDGGATVAGLAHQDVQTRAMSTGFDDISVTGTALTPSVNNLITPPGFRMPFFDRIVGDRIWVSTHGYLSFSRASASNSTSSALPNTRIEPYSVAARWTFTTLSTTNSVFWQLKPVEFGQVLIVQWNTSVGQMQTKLFSSGQVDLEYRALSSTTGQAGMVGPGGDWAVALSGPQSMTGFSFFAPHTSPVLVQAYPATVRGTASLTGAGPRFPVRVTMGRFANPTELAVTEALVTPRTGLSSRAAWFELTNNGSFPVDLAGWGLANADGGVAALSGVLDAGASIVIGRSADPAETDDAGVGLVLADYEPPVTDAGADAGGSPIVSLVRSGTFSSIAFTPFDAGVDSGVPAFSTGVALVNDPGPYRVGSETVSRPVKCWASQAFGGLTPPQLGSPGDFTSCFGYRLQKIPVGYFDISQTGARVAFTDDPNPTSGVTQVSLAAAPFPFFDVPQPLVAIAANGFLSFDGTTTDSTFSSSAPSTSAPNGVIAVFADDLYGRASFNSGVYQQRVAANQDPAAPAPHWIIQWSHFSGFVSSTTLTGDDINMQVKLFDDGAIELHFAQMYSNTSSAYASGALAVTWLENPTGTQALVVNANSVAPGISPNTAYRFIPEN